MRARRLLARRRLPSSKRAGDPTLGRELDRTQSSNKQLLKGQRSLLPPGVFSPRHPHSFRFEHGMYKYTTGMRIPSSSIKRSFNATDAALKVYSTQALSSSVCSSVHNLLLANDNYPPATSLMSALKYLYHITAKAHTVVDSIAGVFFQVCRNRNTLRSLRLPWTSLSAGSRQWNLYCETYRSHPASAISVPRICLSIISFRERFELQHGPWSKGPNLITVQVCADVCAPVLQDNATDEQPHGQDPDRTSNMSIQSIVDDIICSMARVTRRSGIHDHDDLLTKLKTAVSTTLQTSVLPLLVRFRDMELVIVDPFRQRYVSNALLNPDGSEQYGNTDTRDGQKSPVTVIGGNRTSSNAMSELTKDKLGVEIMRAAVDIPPETPIDSPPITAAELIQEFDILCRTSEETALECCIKAVHAISRKHEDIYARFSFNINDHSSSNSRKIGDVVFHTHGKAELGPHLIDMAGSRDPVKVRLDDSTETTVRIRDARISFDVSKDSDQDLQCSSRARTTAADEAYVLRLAFDSVCEQVLERMVFRSLDETPYKLAEAVLEILKIPDSRIILTGVVLDIQPVNDAQTLFRAQATRETESYSTVTASDAAAPSSSNALARRHEDITQIRTTTHEELSQARMAKPPPRTKMASSTETGGVAVDTSVSQPKVLELKSWKYGELNLVLTPTWAKSKILEDKTGYETFRVLLGWPTSAGGAPADITAERLNQAVENIIQNYPGRSVSSFHVLSEMLESESRPQRVRLYFRKRSISLPIDIDRKSGRPGLTTIMQSEKPNSNANVSRTDNNLSISLPAFCAPVELDGQSLTSGTKVHFMFTLEGQLIHRIQLQETTEAEQLCRLFQTVHSLSIVFLHRSFPNFKALASDLVDAVFDKRHEFDPAIDIRSVKLIAQIRNSVPKSPPREKAEVSRAVESNKVEGDKAEAEPLEDAPLTLAQEAEIDIAEERNHEMQPAETTLSILEPRNNEVATQLQDDVSAEALTAISETSEPDDDIRTTQDEGKNENPLNNRFQTAYIALGSNVGDRLENIENACSEMDTDPDIRIIRTSPLYETNPMYVADQDSFLNGACEIATKLKPLELLDRLKAIEDRLGRIKTIDKGPRSIDLDILLYGQEVMETDRLTIPHPLMHEREFVLRPLRDIPSARHLSIRNGLGVQGAFDRLPKAQHPVYSLVPIGPSSKSLHPLDPNRTTRIMSVLNVTPDSFSDGGDNQVSNTEKLRETIRAQIEGGATIIDVGGQSSRPNAPDITAEEEISRILPAIEALRSLPEATNIAISVDTYRAPVAEAAVKAGAHIINDISAGKLDPDMFSTVARLGCTYVMMHMRGTPATMMDPENCTYREGILREMMGEFKAQLNRAEEAGIRRWRIILDPGIGFSKTPNQNIEVLTQLSELRRMLRGYPWLVGTSRKSFIGKITGVTEPKERVWGTAATVTAAVQGGADIVRVHDVREMADVVKMADSMYRV